MNDNILKSFFLTISILLSGSLNAQNTNLNLSRWHLRDKIESSDYMPVDKSGLYCLISNDNENVYIDMKVEDTKIQHRILTEGLTIWINMDGREEKKMGIRYPLGSQNKPRQKNAGQVEKNQTRAESIEVLIANATTIEIVGFISEQQRRFPSENRDSFRGSVKLEEGTKLYYELVMPMAKLPLRNSRNGHGTMPFFIGIEYGFLSVTNNSVNRGPAPASKLHSGPSARGGSELIWIKDVRLATSR